MLSGFLIFSRFESNQLVDCMAKLCRLERNAAKGHNPNLLWCQIKIRGERPNCYNKNTISLVKLTLINLRMGNSGAKMECACLILGETDTMLFVVSEHFPMFPS